MPGGRVFEAQQTKSVLQSLAKQLGDAVSPLRGCISKPGACQNIYRGTAGILGGASIGLPLSAIITYNGSGSLPVAVLPKKKAPTEWLLGTVPGTNVKDFQTFIKGLPDGGAGEQMIYGGSDHQDYVGKMTREEALVINRDPIVDFIVSNEAIDIMLFSNSTMTRDLRRRAFVEPTIIREEDPERYQAMLSWKKTDRISDMPQEDYAGLYQYTLEASAGHGTFVYLFDAGFQFSHEVSRSYGS